MDLARCEGDAAAQVRNKKRYIKHYLMAVQRLTENAARARMEHRVSIYKYLHFYFYVTGELRASENYT